MTSSSSLCPDRRQASSSISSSSSQPQEHCLASRSSSFSEGRSPLEQPSAVPPSHIPSPKDPFSPANEMSSSTTSQSEDTWTGSQDDPQSDANDGPEYLAIGNLGRRGRACSSASTSSSKSSSSNMFSSSSSQKLDSGDRGANGCGSRGLGLLRRSSFSEGQSSVPQGILKKSHVRSHSDTNVASGKLHGNGVTLLDAWGGCGMLAQRWDHGQVGVSCMARWDVSCPFNSVCQMSKHFGGLIVTLHFPAPHWSDGLTSECPGPVWFWCWQLRCTLHWRLSKQQGCCRISCRAFPLVLSTWGIKP